MRDAARIVADLDAQGFAARSVAAPQAVEEEQVA
jgi:hypothetical protein